ncbi:SURF1 family protein [Stappia sp. F7233]|uniref:SURF1-like protein n=1 Tax=Stappia albiluteola TaxID=2758565 RepID=A0A839AI19_9HYPH|nr:SURF1 family protein [Stappia albiluteola]
MAAALGFAVLLSLGIWQVQRLAWKESLIARVNERLDLAPVALPGPGQWAEFDTDRWDYRAVAAEGRFLPGELYYYIALGKANGPLNGPGYFVYSPFETEQGFVVMVNRGFVPDGQRLPEARPGSDAPSGEVRISGLLRRAEVPNYLSVEPDLAKRIWFVREPERMADSLGVSGLAVAPYAVDLGADATLSGGLPQAGETIVSFTNNHLQYAGTWFGLAAVLLVMYALFVRSRLSVRKAE